MLKPDDREQLLAALRPPTGYVLDYAVGTTFSLDLLALLTVPLTFTFFQLEDPRGAAGQDPLAVLEALRQYAGRMTVFCQAGQIAVPPAQQLLFSYLEDSVVEVAPRSKGVFHPKVWALRYTPTEPDAARPIAYRLLVMSRNLTFDRSWDTVLVLDGELSSRKNGFGPNWPLREFFEALPGLATRTVDDATAARVAQIASELHRVQFTLPNGFKTLEFLPLGLGRKNRWPFDVRRDKFLIVSPFVTEGFLRRVGDKDRPMALVSRLDTLSSLSAADLEPCRDLFVLDPTTETALELDEEAPGVPAAVSEFGTSLSGLHAKLYVADQGWSAQIWTGSANATDAAFEQNIEFMVSLTGWRSEIGVEQLLAGTEKQAGFRDLLKRYTPSDLPLALNPELKKLEERAVQLQLQLSHLPLAAEVESTADDEQYRLILKREGAWTSVPGTEATIRCWPITLAPDRSVALNLELEQVAQFDLSLEALTSFIAIEIRVTAGDLAVTKRFVVKVPVRNMPVKRQDRILRRLLGDRNKVMRYLLMLLASDDDIEDLIAISVASHEGNGSAEAAAGLAGVMLLELLLKALVQHPEKLDRVQRLVDDIMADKDGKALLPEGFHQIWEPIWQTRQRGVEERATT